MNNRSLILSNTFSLKTIQLKSNYYKKYPVERHVEFGRKHEAVTLKVIDPWQNLKRNSLGNTLVSGKIWISILFLIEGVPA